MKTNMTKDEFAKFIFSKGLETDQYNYDLFYDISTISDAVFKCLRDNAHCLSEAHEISFYWYFKKRSGSWMIDSPNETADNASDEAYRFIFTPNCDYLLNVPFVIVDKIR